MIALGNLIQFQDMNGSLLAAGYVFVYHLGRSELATIYNDHNGAHVADNPVRLDDMGMCDIYLNECYNYTVVVMDAYGQEMFSRDLYPNKAGGGDGRYEGVDPIVVNNDVNVISANTTHFGVQEPLYFVRDDESATIIGFSGSETPAGTMNESALGYQDGKITGYNGSAFSAGNSYEEGSYISIDGNTISVTGLQPAGDYQSAGDYVSASELENLQPRGDYYSASNPSGFLNKESADTLYQEKGNYQTAGDYYSASNPSGFINSDAISAMATTGFVAGVSADITAMIPTALTGDYLTKESADTLYQPIGNYQTAGNYQSALTFNYTNDNEISGINGSAIYGQGDSDYELVEGNGIQITDDPTAQTTTISVSGDYATNTQLQAVSADITALIPTALTGDYVTADVLSSYKLENSALTVSSVTPGPGLGINTGVAEYGIDGVHLASGFENQYDTGSYTELSLRPEGLSGYSGYSGYYFNINATGVSGAQGSTALSYYLSPECVSGYNNSTAWQYGDKFTNAGFIVSQYGTGYFITQPYNSGSDYSIAINNFGLTASGGSGNSAKSVVNPWDVGVTSYNAQKTYSLTAIGESQPTTGNMSSYKYIEFPYKLGIFGHTANVREARKELDWFDVDAAFNNASQGIVSGNDWYNYINIPFMASSDAYDIRWNFIGGYGNSGFTAAVLTATADGNWMANSIASASFDGKSGFLNVTGLTENTTYYLYVTGSAPYYGTTAITPFTAEIGSAFWYDYTATSAGFIIPDEPVLTFKVIGE